jgi:uncharacterized protein (DUF433 family)
MNCSWGGLVIPARPLAEKGLARMGNLRGIDHCNLSQVIGDAPAIEIAIDQMATARIEINSAAMLGKPVINAPRIAVEPIISQLGERATEADLMNADPCLTREGIQAALTYAADVLAPETRMPQTAR